MGSVADMDLQRLISPADPFHTDEYGAEEREFLWGFFRRVRESVEILERDRYGVRPPLALVRRRQRC